MIRKLAYFFLIVSILSLVLGIGAQYIRFSNLGLENYFRIPFTLFLLIYLVLEWKGSIDWQTLSRAVVVFLNVTMWISMFLVWSTTVTKVNSGDPGIEIAVLLLLTSILCAGLIFIRNLAIASWFVILGIHILTVHSYNMSIRGG